MQIDRDGFLQLTYCTNIHPGDGWEAVSANLRQYAPALRQRLAPDGPFGVGLRLSARDARELLEGNRLDDLRAFLDDHGLYVALLNGFPHGSFHGRVVKADVFAPDWREDERMRYTFDLVRILARLLPDGSNGPALDGGISTIPLSYKPWLAGEPEIDWQTIARNLARIVLALVRLRQDEGRWIHLDIEPEPDGLVERTDEVVQFFQRWLLPVGGAYLSSWLGIDADAARQHLLDHVQVCFDCCHVAVEFEEPAAAIRRLTDAGIRIGRVQLSSALKAPLPGEAAARGALAARLAPFAESTYLHQVIECCGDGGRRSFRDLDLALADAPDRAAEWRIHFHVPLFTSEYEGLGSTQEDVRQTLAAVTGVRVTRHLEIETYTWDVLPPGLKVDLLDSIDREYRWVLDELRRLRD